MDVMAWFEFAEKAGAPPMLVMFLAAVAIIIGLSYKVLRDKQTNEKDRHEAIRTYLKDHPDLLGKNLQIYRDVAVADALKKATGIHNAKTEMQCDAWMEIHAESPKNTIERCANASKLIGVKGRDPREPIGWLLHSSVAAMDLLCLALIFSTIAVVDFLVESIIAARPLMLVLQLAGVALIYIGAFLMAWLNIVGPYISAALIAHERWKTARAKLRSLPASDARKLRKEPFVPPFAPGR